MQTSLVAALVARTDPPVKVEARRFLSGLSSDELQFIAEFLGACKVERWEAFGCSRGQLAERIAYVQQARADCRLRSEDLEHKMILVLEYLCRCGLQLSAQARAGHA